METNDQIFKRQLIRHVTANALNLSGGEEREQEIRKSFHRCMLERIKRLKAKRKKQMQDEGLMSFVHASGGGLAHAGAKSSLMSSTASHTTPNSPTYTVAAINKFKAANGQKNKKNARRKTKRRRR